MKLEQKKTIQHNNNFKFTKMNQEKINLRQVRDFGETFNASIKLVRQNFKLFLKYSCDMILIF